MNQNSSELVIKRPDSDQAFDLMQEGLAISDENPSQALELLEQSARKWLRQDDKRRAAFVLHQRAALSLKNSQSPVKDLAMAARLLKNEPEARAVLLLDLGQALTQEREFRRAALALRESEKLARKANNIALSEAARYALGDVSVGGRRKVRTRTTTISEEAHPEEVRHAGFTMIYDVENDLLTTLHHIGNLPDDPLVKRERERRAQAVEDELAALKREMGLE